MTDGNGALSPGVPTADVVAGREQAGGAVARLAGVLSPSEWRVVLSIAAITLFGFGANWYALGVLFSPMVADFGWGRGEYSLATGLYLGIQTLATAPLGRLVDRFGPRRVIAVCGLANGAIWLLVSQIGHIAGSASLWPLLVLYALMGVASAGIGPVPTITIIVRTFSRRRGLAMGISSVGFGLPGVLLVPLSAPYLAAFGWRSLAALLGVLCMAGCAAVAYAGIRDPGPGAGTQVSMGTRGIKSSLAFRSPAFWILSVALLLQAFGSNAAQLQAIPMLTDRGLSTQTASNMWGSLAMTGIIGKLALGVAGERFPGKPLLVISIALQSTALGALLVFPGAFGGWLFSLVFGLGLGGQMVARPLMFQDTFGLVEFATISGLIVLLTVPGTTLGQPLAGYLFDATRSYTLAYALFCGALVVGTLMVSLVRPAARKCSGSQTSLH